MEREEPAYARVAEDPQLRAYKWSSFPIFCGEGKRPKWLRAADAFSWHHFDWRRPANRRHSLDQYPNRYRRFARALAGAQTASGAHHAISGVSKGVRT